MHQLKDLAPSELASLLCSRVCHDIISPVGAINNGLELLDEGGVLCGDPVVDHHRAGADLALEGDAPAMPVEAVLDDGEAQPRAPGGAVARVGRALECVEQ